MKSKSKSKLKSKMKLVLGVAIALCAYSTICDGPKGECPSKANQMVIGGYHIHLHHWLIHAVLLLIYVGVVGGKDEVVIGINVGGMLHGIIGYDDWMNVIQRNAEKGA